MQIDHIFILTTCLMTCVNIKSVASFFPASFIDQVINKLSKQILKPEDTPHETTTHDEIIERGALRSIIDYFSDRSNGSYTIDLRYSAPFAPSNYSIRQLYHDVYGAWICAIKVETIIKQLQLDDAFVDIDSRTKDLPYAHFDAETFKQSNALVMNVTDRVYMALNSSDYGEARKRSGRALHTIQDFYSHTNWVEKGEREINKLIGTRQFDDLEFVLPDDADAPCVENCVLVTRSCGVLDIFFNKLLTSSRSNKLLVSCPIEYYRCDTNNVVTNKLVSGYYANQRLENGDPYPKPVNKGKCSHGGSLLDSSANENSKGGMSKDSGYFLISPHAHLHNVAAELAIQHTKYFFDKIRADFGDNVYAKFFGLDISPVHSVVSDYLKNQNLSDFYLCDATRLRINEIQLLAMIFSVHMLILVYVIQ